MNREDIIRMAREAGLDIDSWEPLYEGGLTGFGVYECTHEELERFAALVASAEREKINDEAKAHLQELRNNFDVESTELRLHKWTRGQA